MKAIIVRNTNDKTFSEHIENDAKEVTILLNGHSVTITDIGDGTIGIHTDKAKLI